MATASAMSPSTVLVVEKPQMVEMLRTHSALAERFLAHMLARNIRVEEDLIDQLFNSSEKRLARVLLLLARYGKTDQRLRIPKMSQETLAEIVGTTRSRVNFFMNKFRDLGFIEYNGDITVNSSLLTVVLHD
jgi:CRP-like cAMP-binding protein